MAATLTPWVWRTSRQPWYAALPDQVRRWRPSPSLDLHVPDLVDAVCEEADRAAEWLWHPSTAAVTTNARGRSDLTDLLFVVWAASHVPAIDGELTFAGPAAVWLPSGERRVSRGRWRLRDLVPAAEAHASPELALDPWCTTVGSPAPSSWAEAPPLNEAEEAALRGEVVRFLRATSYLQNALPDCYAWLNAITKIAVPLRAPGEGFSSCSFQDIAGLVELDLKSEVMILESLVHESAHLYLYVAEADEPLTDPDDDARFPSPLRPDPRPLRGVLMALHALAFVSVMYAQLAEQSPATALLQESLAWSLRSARDAEDVLVQQRRRLTDAGRRFLRDTQQVLAHAAA
jgi:HEXXH motif-containing protein